MRRIAQQGFPRFSTFRVNTVLLPIWFVADLASAKISR
jgi:hypothetical protein